MCAWEQGGKWVFQEKRTGGMPCKNFDNMWLYTMMSLVGENFPEEDQVCVRAL